MGSDILYLESRRINTLFLLSGLLMRLQSRHEFFAYYKSIILDFIFVKKVKEVESLQRVIVL